MGFVFRILGWERFKIYGCGNRSFKMSTTVFKMLGLVLPLLSMIMYAIPSEMGA